MFKHFVENMLWQISDSDMSDDAIERLTQQESAIYSSRIP